MIRTQACHLFNLFKIPGPIGSKLKNVESRPLNKDFTPVTKFPLVEYPEEVFKKLSADQKALVRMATAVSTGTIPDNMEDYALGKMHNAR